MVDSSPSIELINSAESHSDVDPPKPSFHSKRSSALTNPVEAQVNLAPYAKLTVKVIKAANVTGFDPVMTEMLQFWKKEKKKTADPYVRVRLNDVTVANNRDNYLSNTTEPEWNWTEVPVINIKSAGSIIRFEVMDHDLISSDDLCGFVEFPVQDLPHGQTLAGWFELRPKSALVSRASKRIKQVLSDHVEDGGKCGHLYAEVTLDIVSEDASDTWYAHCLPAPDFVTYPSGGFQRDGEPMNTQAIYDFTEEFVHLSIHDMLLPCCSSMIFVCGCKDPCIGLLLFLGGAASIVFPFYCIAIFFLVTALLFLCLIREKLRRRIIADPDTAPLNKSGLETVVLLNDAEKIAKWVERLVHIMNGEVMDQAELLEFTQITFVRPSSRRSDGSLLFDYKTLKQKLREVAGQENPWVWFDDKPFKEFDMADKDGDVAEVMACNNPEATPGDRTYKIRYIYKGGKVEDDVKGDKLDEHMDLQWMSRDTVAMFIPVFLKRTLLRVEDRVEDMHEWAKYYQKRCHEIVTWKSRCESTCIFLMLILLSAGWACVGYFLESTPKWYILAVISGFLFSSMMMMTAVFFAVGGACRSFYAWKRAKARLAARTDATTWPFFKECGRDEEVGLPIADNADEQ